MAIVKMKKVTLIGLSSDKNALLDDLMWLSAIDVSPLADKLETDEWQELAKSDGAQATVAELEEKVSLLEKTLKTYRLYSKEKRSLFTPYAPLKRSDFADFSADDKGVISAANETARINDALVELKNEENRLDGLYSRLLPWQRLALPLNEKPSEHTSYFFGSLPLKTEISSVTEGELTSDDDETIEKVAAWTEQLASDKEYTYMLVVCLTEQERKITSALADIGFNKMSFPGLSGTAAENLKRLQHEKEDITDRRAAYLKQLEKYSERLSDTEKAIDILENEARLAAVREKLLLTDAAFMLEGWSPVDRLSEVAELCGKYGAYLISEDPAPDEEPPIKLKNAKLIEPFEPITEMYALPTYRGIDPNFAVGPFYFIFFGMMLSDAGYGILLAVACALALKFTNMRGGLRKMVKMFMFGGISTIFWGFMFGSFFGDSVAVVSSLFFGGNASLPPVWFDPVKDPITLLIVSFVAGFIHILVGLGIKFYMLIRDGHIFSAIFDIGCWMILLIGIPIIIVNSTVGAIVTGAGALGLILTQGRDKKGILGKVIGGVGSLYGITGYLSDILSYSRILALGLSAGVIGSVFNKLGSLGGANIVGVILFIVVFVAGHILNIALSTLGAYVHASRLQFIEFFSKFYESGGRAFDELGVKCKYTEVTNK